ncbi:MAG: hypothetical protein JO020_10220 [Chloroflexi bacterium]|nr:hypothetical protein [Chloroflexota bacterium]MBV9894535.1 hypothetical protein [Chloroflexota bacterium]
MDGSLKATDHGRLPGACITHAQRTKRRVALLDALSDCVVDHTLSGHFHERPFVKWLSIGIPCLAADGASPVRSASEDRRPVRVLHAPSDPEAKGTSVIRSAIQRLQSRGFAVELREIAGRPHREVIQALQDCDFVVDQAYSDTPMAGFSAEAAFYGKAVVVGGYGEHALRASAQQVEMPPSAFCHPDDLEQTIAHLVVDEGERLSLGRAAQEFVRNQWSRRAVAERFLCLISGRIPEEWLFDPRVSSYAHGVALPESRARRLMADVIALGGTEALQLGDKPYVLQAMLEFAYQDRTVGA